MMKAAPSSYHRAVLPRRRSASQPRRRSAQRTTHQGHRCDGPQLEVRAHRVYLRQGQARRQTHDQSMNRVCIYIGVYLPTRTSVERPPPPCDSFLAYSTSSTTINLLLFLPPWLAELPSKPLPLLFEPLPSIRRREPPPLGARLRGQRVRQPEAHRRRLTTRWWGGWGGWGRGWGWGGGGGGGSGPGIGHEQRWGIAAGWESILVLFVTWWWAGNIGERRRIGGGLLGVQVLERREVTRRKRTQLLEGGPLLEGGSLLEGGLLLEGGSLLETLVEGGSILDGCAWHHLEQPEGRGAHPPAEGARKAREAAHADLGGAGGWG